ncbi:MAG TPA: YobA family protein [Candidatus Mediterraneibacter excrementavium]|nr:YobA family protein [Candidatus Mediterraneibacter excrementavium]
MTVTVKDKNDLAALKKGDKIKIFFDGSIQESSPPSINAEEIILISHN